MRHILILLLVLTAHQALGKAYFASEEEMVQRSEVIAIVDISKVDPLETKGAHWTYRERAQGSVHETIKGSLPQNIELYGNETFICAQVRFRPGRHLVFLRRDGSKLVGSNWHLSVRPTRGAEVEWYVPGKRLELSWQPLADVLERIKNTKSAPPKSGTE